MDERARDVMMRFADGDAANKADTVDAMLAALADAGLVVVELERLEKLRLGAREGFTRFLMRPYFPSAFHTMRVSDFAPLTDESVGGGNG